MKTVFLALLALLLPISAYCQIRSDNDRWMNGRDTMPGTIHFTTWTLRYNRMHWVTVDAMSEHWKRARLEALYADDRALERRFARWFPEPRPGAGENLPPEEGTMERGDLEAVVVLLATVAEVKTNVGDAP